MIRRRLSIRARITAGSFLLALVFFAGTAFVVHAQVRGILDRSTLELLESDSAPYVSAGVNLPTETLETPGEDQRVAVIDAAGVLRLTTLPARLSGEIATFRSGQAGPRVFTASGHSYRLFITRVDTASGVWTVVAARSEAANELVLSRLTVGLAWGLAGLSVLFALASWLLTGAALRPVTRLRRSADSLARSGSAELLQVGSTRDEVSELAATLNRLISGLHDSAAREKQLVSDASHELRTPLAILKARLELLGRAVPEQHRDDVSAAESAVQRLSLLVADLLELSRLEANARGSASYAELGAALEESVDRSRFAASAGDVTIDYEVGAGVGRVGMSADTFGRVADNLIKNAVAAGASQVGVRLEGHEGARLVVSDDGPGMSPEFVARAFDRFSREDVSRTNHGTGLGLSIVHAAVEAAGGTVELDNSPQGLSVSVGLPPTPDAQPESPAATSPTP